MKNSWTYFSGFTVLGFRIIRKGAVRTRRHRGFSPSPSPAAPALAFPCSQTQAAPGTHTLVQDKLGACMAPAGALGGGSVGGDTECCQPVAGPGVGAVWGI